MSISPPFRFVPYDRTTDRPNVVVDGSANAATVLVLSHWPGVMPLPGCAADASAQMVFRYLDRGADLHGDAVSVTNNHFDQDGLAGIYALLRPDHAMRHRSLVEGLALAGDFGTTDDRDAARLSMAVSALSDPSRSPLRRLPAEHGAATAALYESALELLPAWLEDPGTCRDLWEEEDAVLSSAYEAIASGAVAVIEDLTVDLAVVTLPASRRSAGHRFSHRSFEGVHPIALHAATDRSTVLTVDEPGGRHRVTCRYEGWVQFRSRPIRPRVDLQPLAAQLSVQEPAGARWTATGPSDLTPELSTDPDGPPSSLRPAELVAAVTEHLHRSPVAWDPYAVPVP